MDEEKVRIIIQKMIDNNEPDEKIREFVRRVKEMETSTQSSTTKAEPDAKDNVATGAELIEHKTNIGVEEDVVEEPDGGFFTYMGTKVAEALNSQTQAVEDPKDMPKGDISELEQYELALKMKYEEMSKKDYNTEEGVIHQNLYREYLKELNQGPTKKVKVVDEQGNETEEVVSDIYEGGGYDKHLQDQINQLDVDIIREKPKEGFLEPGLNFEKWLQNWKEKTNRKTSIERDLYVELQNEFYNRGGYLESEDADFIEAQLFSQEPSKPFYAIVDTNGNLLDWRQYYEDHPTQVDGTDVTGDKISDYETTEEILKNNPGSFVIKDAQSLKNYAASKGITNAEALQKIRDNASRYQAYSEYADKMLNAGMEMEDIKHDYTTVSSNTLSPKTREIIEEDIVMMDLIDKHVPEEAKLLFDELYNAKKKEQQTIENIKARATQSKKPLSDQDYKEIADAKKEFQLTKSEIPKKLDVLEDLSAEDEKVLKAQAKSILYLQDSQYGVGYIEQPYDRKMAELGIEFAKEKVESLKDVVLANTGPDKIINEYLSEQINKGLDLFEGWVDEKALDFEVTESDVANAMLMIHRAAANPDTTQDEMAALMKNYSSLRNKWQKDGVRKMWNAKGEYVSEEEIQTVEEREENNRINAAATEYSRTHAYEDLLKLRHEARVALDAARLDVLAEDKVGNFWNTSILDYANYRLYQDLEDKSAPLRKIPGDGTPAIAAFNQALDQWRITNKALMLNMDPMTLEQEGAGDWFFQGFTKGFLGWNDEENTDVMARSWYDIATSRGFPVSEGAQKRIEQSNAEFYGGGAGSLMSFIANFWLFKRAGGALLKKTPIPDAVKLYEKAIIAKVPSRPLKTITGGLLNAAKDVAIGVPFDKLSKQINSYNEEFGWDMWAGLGFFGFLGSSVIGGLSTLGRAKSVKGRIKELNAKVAARTATREEYKQLQRLVKHQETLSYWERFNQSVLEFNKTWSYPIMSRPAAAAGAQFVFGTAASTGAMVTSEFLTDWAKEGGTFEEAFDRVFRMKDPYNPDKEMPVSAKLLHTAAMMAAGGLAHGDRYVKVYSEIKRASENYKAKKSLPSDLEFLGTNEAEVSKNWEQGTDLVFMADLKRKALSKLKKQRGEKGKFGKLTEADKQKVQSALDNVAESANMNALKDLILINEDNAITDKNIDREIFYLQNRLIKGISGSGAEFKINAEDADWLFNKSGSDPRILDYLAHQIKSTKSLDNQSYEILKSKLEYSGFLMNQLREYSSSRVWKDPVKMKKAYESMDRFYSKQSELDKAKEELSKNKDILNRDKLKSNVDRLQVETSREKMLLEETLQGADDLKRVDKAERLVNKLKKGESIDLLPKDIKELLELDTRLINNLIETKLNPEDKKAAKKLLQEYKDKATVAEKAEREGFILQSKYRDEAISIMSRLEELKPKTEDALKPSALKTPMKQEVKDLENRLEEIRTENDKWLEQKRQEDIDLAKKRMKEFGLDKEYDIKFYIIF